MPVEAKPLFRPDVLRAHLAGFELPPHIEACRPKLAHWAHLLASGKAHTFNEQEILPDFLTDFFCDLLGYTRPADGGPRYTISREKHVQVDGKFADAVLGDFGRGPDRFIVALEGKGPKDPLDRPFAGRHMSAVDQAYRYAINLPCDFVIVTSIRQTRLYYKGADQQTYQPFDTEQLAESDALLKPFVFLLGAERVVPETVRCHFHELLAESERVGKQLTKQFYLRYADMRHDAFEQLCRDNPNVPRHDVLSCAQKLLDRVLFCAFCEDRGLLPTETIRKAYQHQDPYHPHPIWDNFRGLFHSINLGNAALGIHAYDGGLFADDPVLDNLKVSDEVCAYFHELGEFDYRPAHQAAAYAPTAGNRSLIDVDILGHIFEQSITDLEKLRNELDGLVKPASVEKHKTRRKKEGAFYTPAFVTRYIIEQALGGVLRDRFDALRSSQQKAAKGTARMALADPAVYELDKLKKPQRVALIRFWEAWQDELEGIRLLDPACGSGAFLIEAFDQLHAAYQASNDRLEELRGHRTLFDLDKRILEKNLYGVDLNEEAIEICRLSLWIKTAAQGKVLTSLDHTVRVGNSIIADPAVHPKAFDWQAAFPEVFARGGFDVVVANPPYVRQELLSPIKPYLQSAYQAYHGTADLYVYFYELGVRLLKPGGLLSYVVTNKWMKANYGEPLRCFFAKHAWIQSVVDFGHAKQIFKEVDVFPSIIVVSKPSEAPKPTTARLCTIPREQLRIDDLSRQIEQEGFDIGVASLAASPWELQPDKASNLLDKLRSAGTPLRDFAGVSALYGIKTGLNAAFLIDTTTRDSLIKADPSSTEIIRPYLRGQDVKRWTADWPGLWMIFARRGIDIEKYPSVKNHLAGFRARLEPKPRDWQGERWPGRKPGTYAWCEIQDPVDYWQEFAKPKIVYQDIMWRPQYCLDISGTLLNNTTYFLPTNDKWVLTVLNSPVAWWLAWRAFRHGKDEALRVFTDSIEAFPVPPPTDAQRHCAEEKVDRLAAVARRQYDSRSELLDWLRVQHEIEKPSMRLRAPVELDCDAFVAEVKKVRGKKRPLSAPALKNLREEHARSIEPARALAAEALKLEHEVNNLVNEAYGLTPDEVALMWQTAPPRMPITLPQLPDTSQ